MTECINKIFSCQSFKYRTFVVNISVIQQKVTVYTVVIILAY